MAQVAARPKKPRTSPDIGGHRQAATRPRRAATGSLRHLRHLTNYLFIFPALAFFAVFTVYPFAKTMQLAFYAWDGVSPRLTPVGWENFRRIFAQDPAWWTSMLNGVWFTVLGVGLMLPLAMALALAVNARHRGQRVYSVLFYLPVVLSQIVVGFIWKWIYEPYSGLLNYVLGAVGSQSLTHAWLAEPRTALVAVSIASIWQGFGNPFVLFLAGLQGIPNELYEAAAVDGATWWKQFTRITLPVMVSTLTIVSILTVLGAMQLFGIIVAMTNGGPGLHTEVPALRIYKEAFQFNRFGYASAQAIVFGCVLLAVSSAQLYVSRRKSI